MNELKNEHRLTEVEEGLKANALRLDKVEKKQTVLEKLATSVEVLATRQSNVEDDVKEIKNTVKALEIKPARRWETLIETATGLVLAAVIGFIFARIGL